MIIKSVLQTDLYKMTMQQSVIEHYPDLMVRYKFTDRNKIEYPDGFDELLKEEIKNMNTLFLTKDEKFYLQKTFGHFLKPEYINFLEKYRFNPSELDIKLDDEKHLDLMIEGLWSNTINWEVTLMNVISELYFKTTGQEIDIYTDEIKSLDIEKIKIFNDCNASVTDMGTRRAYSVENHLRVLKNFKEFGGNCFKGTSNVYFGYLLDIPVYGSIAHEYIMVNACVHGYTNSTKVSMDRWMESYPSVLQVFLPDTYPLDIFLKDFDLKYANHFKSIRHDSGSPFEFIDTMVNHYIKLGIDPMTKSLIFSDSLNSKNVVEIQKYCNGRINISFGIGTFLTNNLPGIKPLNIVIKIYQVLVDGVWKYAVKLSNDKGKHTGNLDEVNKCKKTLNIES